MNNATRDEAIYLSAIERTSPEGRLAYLDAACGTDSELRRRVDGLIEAHAKLGQFLQLDQDATQAYVPAANAASISIGTVISDRYKLLERIGEGGMGEVWVAVQSIPVKRKVAIKLIKAGMDSRNVLARFEAERQALAVMDHPNIAKVLDGGLHDGRPYFVMELVKGVPITEFCDARKLTPRERLELFVPVCQAIQHAHQKGVIHRDIKPSNVLVALYDDCPVPKVIDFGVAKAAGQTLTDMTLHTGFGTVVGTPEYMSPEQASFNNLDIDTRSDVYSLGVLLYELLTGTTPVDRKSLKEAALLEVLRIVREVEAPRPSQKLSTTATLANIAANRGIEPSKLPALMRGELDWIVLKALEKDRGRRYESANGLAADVQRYLIGDAVSACPPTFGYRLQKMYRRHKSRILTATAVVLAVLTGAVAVTWQSIERKRERSAQARQQEAQAERAQLSATQQLERAEAGLRGHQLREAINAIQQAELQLVDLDDPNLRERLATAKRDLATTQKLDEAFAWRWNVAKGQVKLLPTKAKEMYPAALREYGLAVGQEPPETIVQAVRRSTIADALWVALYQWYFLEPSADGLRAVLDTDDPDPLRTEIRAAVAAGQAEQVQQLTRRLDPGNLNPAFAAALGMALPIEDSPRLLKAVWRRQPDSFPLAMTIAARLTEMDVLKGSPADAIGWCRLAVALRPDSAFARHCHGLALSEGGDIEGGLAEMEEAMRLAPRFQRAASLYIYSAAPSWKETPPAARDRAFALCQQLLRLNPNHQVARAGLIEIYFSRKDWLEMAAQHRKLFELIHRPASEIAEEYTCPEETLIWISILGLKTGLMLEHLVTAGNLDVVFELCVQCNARHWGYDLKPIAYWNDYGHNRRDNLFHGVRAGVSWAAGKGQKPIPESQRDAVRRQAREWLAFLVTGGKEFLDADLGKNRNHVHQVMTNWLADPSLASVRDEAKLAELPVDERTKWQALCTDMKALQARSSPPPALK